MYMEDIDPTWAAKLAPMHKKLVDINEFLRQETEAGYGYLPSEKNLLRAFTYPFEDVRVLIVGQDPYPTPGNPVGLSFSVAPDVQPIPASLRNIYRELNDDLGITPAPNGDLSRWCDQGVMLLNRVLSVRPGHPQSHQGHGWEEVTDHAIRCLAERGGPLVAILWGRAAQQLKPLLGNIPTIESAHPSPLSARRGFFGSRPFSHTNKLLISQGAQPIDWRVSA